MRATEKWITDAGLDEIVLIDAWGEVAWGEVESALLKPEHWQAVGKTRRWPDNDNTFSNVMEWWKAKYIGFFNHLAGGLTIEEALTALENNSV